jgi:hypothetical protein
MCDRNNFKSFYHHDLDDIILWPAPDGRSVLSLLALIVRHHPRAEDEVVPELTRRLSGICSLLGAGQSHEQQVGYLVVHHTWHPLQTVEVQAPLTCFDST